MHYTRAVPLQENLRQLLHEVGQKVDALYVAGETVAVNVVNASDFCGIAQSD